MKWYVFFAIRETTLITVGPMEAIRVYHIYAIQGSPTSSDRRAADLVQCARGLVGADIWGSDLAP
jgi:hypothetical protein